MAPQQDCESPVWWPVSPGGDAEERSPAAGKQEQLGATSWRLVLEDIELSPRFRALERPEERAAVLALAQALCGPWPPGEDGSRLYGNPAALIRYLRARSWDPDAAEAMIRATARWRAEFGFRAVLDDTHKDMIMTENAPGKMYVRGFDRLGRPAIYMKPRNEVSTDKASMLRHVVYCMERAVACVERQEKEGRCDADGKLSVPNGKFVLLVDFTGYSLSNMIPLSTSAEVLLILQNHYPERLGVAIVVGAPWVMSATINTLATLADPVTRAKFRFLTETGQDLVDPMSEIFDLAELEPDFGGRSTVPFQSHIFTTTEHNGSVFGVEFNEQVKISLAQGYTFQVGSSDPLWSMSHSPFWTVQNDLRILRLPIKQRSAVRGLAYALSAKVHVEEEPKNIFDDAGALIRYLQSEEWDEARAEARVRATARWRKDFDFGAQRSGKYADVIERELSRCRMYVRGYDRRGRPVVYVKLLGADARDAGGFLRGVVYCMERAVACLDRREATGRAAHGQSWAGDAAGGRIVILVDFAGYSHRNRPVLQTVREAFGILQAHYPERLANAYLFHPPLKVSTLWKALSRLIDSETYQKVVLVKEAEHHAKLIETAFNKETLEECVGGENAVPFDPQVFLATAVDGDVYGAEFDGQVAAAAAPEPAETVPGSHPELAGGPAEDQAAEEEEAEFSFDSFFRNTLAALW